MAGLKAVLTAVPTWELVAAAEFNASVAAQAGEAAAVIMQVPAGRPEALQQFQQVVKLAPHSRVIGAVRDASGETVRQLFRAGAVDVLTGPFTADSVRAALTDLFRPAGAEGRIISVVKGCGGAGATTLALNLAALSTEGEPKRGRPAGPAGVLDFDLQFGDSHLALDLTPRTTLVDLLRADSRLDQRLFEEVLVEHRSGVKLLSSAPAITPLDAMTDRMAVEILEHAASRFSRTFVDLPTGWAHWTLRVLARSDAIIVVTTATVAGAVGARRVLDALHGAGVTTPTLLVLNKVTGLVEAVERPAAMGRSLGAKIDTVLAFDPAVPRAGDRGLLVAEAQPKAGFGKELRGLARKLDAQLQSAPAKGTLLEAAE
jgi:pilus assembly protein CpaE